MPVRVSCDCGKVMNVPDKFAGKAGKCPACGKVIQVPALELVTGLASDVDAEPDSVAPAAPEAYETSNEHYARPPIMAPGVQPLQYVSSGGGSGGPIAPPPSDAIRVPLSLPPKLQQPNCAPLFLIMSTAGADVQADFDASPVLSTFAETLAKNLKKRYDVRLDPPTGPGADLVFVRIIQLQEGNRWMRYFLGLLAMAFNAGTSFEIDGNVQLAGVQPIPFRFKHRCHMGMLGGSSLKLLQLDAKVVAKKVAKKVRKAR